MKAIDLTQPQDIQAIIESNRAERATVLVLLMQAWADQFFQHRLSADELTQKVKDGIITGECVRCQGRLMVDAVLHVSGDDFDQRTVTDTVVDGIRYGGEFLVHIPSAILVYQLSA